MNKIMKPTQFGSLHEGFEEVRGYSQAVSGLCPMTEQFELMLEAEAKYWLKFKRENPEEWRRTSKRMRKTRGVIFSQRLRLLMNKFNRRKSL